MKHRRQRKVPLAVIDYELILRLWSTEITTEQMAEALGITRSGIARIRDDLDLPRRPSRKSWHRPHLAPKKTPDPDLSEEEVQHRIAKVQATWTDEMFVLRSQGRVRPRPFVFPTYSLDDLIKRQ